MNVSVTRTRKKFMSVGSRRTMQREPQLASFFAFIQEKGWIRALVLGAHRAHASVLHIALSLAQRVAGTYEDAYV